MDHREGGDLVAKPFLVDSAALISNRCVADFLDFFGVETSRCFRNMITPSLVLFEVLVVVPGVDVQCGSKTFGPR